MGLGVWGQKKAQTFSVLSHFYVGKGSCVLVPVLGPGLQRCVADSSGCCQDILVSWCSALLELPPSRKAGISSLVALCTAGNTDFLSLLSVLFFRAITKQGGLIIKGTKINKL